MSLQCAPVTNLGHQSRKHAILSASGRSRWGAFEDGGCPRSIIESDGLPEVPSSPAAQDGTYRHEWLDLLARKGQHQARDFLGLTLSEAGAVHPGVFPDRKFAGEDADAVNVALDKTWALMAERPGAELYVEQNFDDVLRELHPKLGGTGDIVIASPGLIDVLDFKNGWWLVGAEGNKQCLQYAIGAFRKFRHFKPTVIRIWICQPRDAAQPIKLWTISLLELYDDMQKLRAEAIETDNPNARHNPGKACVFCPAAYHQTCEARKKAVLDEAAKGFVAIKTGAVRDRTELKARLASLPLLEDYVKQLKGYALAEIEAGRGDFGQKLVTFQERTAWKGEHGIVASVLQKAFPTVDPWKPRDLRSPSEIAEEVGKRHFEKTLAGLLEANKALPSDKHVPVVLTKTPFGKQMVEDGDPRPSIQDKRHAKAAEGFTAQPKATA